MNKIFKLAMLAIFLINNGWATANQLESTEAAVAEQEHSFGARGANAGIACYPGDCCSAYRLYVGDTLYPVQETAPGTVCRAGTIIHAYDCTTPCSFAPATPAPTQKATPAPTERPPTQPTERPPTQSTERPTSAPTQAATPAPTERPTSAPTQKATPAPTERPTPAPTQKATPAPTEKPTSAPTQKATPAPTPVPTQKATAAPTAPSVGLCDIVPTSQEPLKFLVPLYVYPSSGKWDPVAEGAKKVPTIAIVNPNNGPTTQPSSSYAAGMEKLKAANAEMVGYVYTSYGDRPIADAKRDIDTFVANWPYITGIFFDEASSKAADVPYYRELYNHVKSKGYKHSILNPGTQPDKAYVDISTNIVIFESYGDKFASKQYESWVKCAPDAAAKSGYKYKFSGIGHSIAGNTASTELIKSMEKSGLGMVYITDGTPADSVYNPLASYYNTEIADIQRINQQ